MEVDPPILRNMTEQQLKVEAEDCSDSDEESEEDEQTPSPTHAFLNEVRESLEERRLEYELEFDNTQIACSKVSTAVKEDIKKLSGIIGWTYVEQISTTRQNVVLVQSEELVTTYKALIARLGRLRIVKDCLITDALLLLRRGKRKKHVIQFMKNNLANPLYTFLDENQRITNLAKPRIFHSLKFHVADFHPHKKVLRDIIDYGGGKHLSRALLNEKGQFYQRASSLKHRMDQVDSTDLSSAGQSLKSERRFLFETDLQLSLPGSPEVFIIVDESVKTKNVLRRFAKYPNDSFAFVTQKWLTDSILQGAPVVICQQLHTPFFS